MTARPLEHCAATWRAAPAAVLDARGHIRLAPVGGVEVAVVEALGAPVDTAVALLAEAVPAQARGAVGAPRHAEEHHLDDPVGDGQVGPLALETDDPARLVAGTDREAVGPGAELGRLRDVGGEARPGPLDLEDGLARAAAPEDARRERPHVGRVGGVGEPGAPLEHVRRIVAAARR